MNVKASEMNAGRDLELRPPSFREHHERSDSPESAATSVALLPQPPRSTTAAHRSIEGKQEMEESTRELVEVGVGQTGRSSPQGKRFQVKVKTDGWMDPSSHDPGTALTKKTADENRHSS